MPLTLNQMRDERNQARQEARRILDAAKEQQRSMTTDEETSFDNAMAQVDQLDALIAAEERLGNEDAAEDRSGGWGGRVGRQTGHDDARRQTDAPPESRAVTIDWYNAAEHRMEKVELLLDEERGQRAGDEYREAWRAYMAEGRAQNLQAGDQGGFIAPMQASSRFIQKLDDMNWMRQLCDNITVQNAGSLGVFGIDTDPSDAEWTSEISSTDVSADSTMKYSRRELTPHLLIKRLDVSRTMVRRLDNIENIINDRLAYKVARTEEAAFLEGSGSGRPLGVFTASADGVGTDRDVVSGSASTITADGLINSLYNLKFTYRRNATWVVSRELIKRIRKLKGSDNNYLWVPNLTPGQPDALLGHPLREAELAPGHDSSNDYDAGDYVAVVGDFSFYQIATAVNLEFLRDEYSSAGRNKIRVFVYHESDGMPLLGEAFSRIKIGT